MIFRHWNLNAQWAHCYWDTGLPSPPSRQSYSNYTYTYTSMLNCLFFANSLPGQHCRWVPAAAPPQSYLPSLSVSPLFSIPPTFLLSLPASSQLSERGPPAGTGSAGPTHRLLSARLASHTACTGQVCSSPALCQPSHPGTTSQTGASRTSIAPPGCLHPHFCCGVISPWPQSLESWMLRQLGTPILFPQIYWTAKGRAHRLHCL